MNKYFSILKFSVYLFLFVFVSACNSGENIQNKDLTVVFYNVENLFDLEDEPEKLDEEFTPESDKKWNKERYDKKLKDISDVLSAINENDLPEIIGLCEVENRKVVSDLAKTGNLVSGKYKVVHHESPDTRGIDCALLYRADEFKVLEDYPIRIKFKDEPGYTTRDILYVRGNTFNKEEFHLFVNHWPSRVEGLQKTEPRRMEVARQLSEFIQAIVEKNKEAKIIIMGDFNDDPTSKSVKNYLVNDTFYNPMERLIATGNGTLSYKRT